MATIIKENKDLPTDSPYKFDNIGGKSQMENKPLAEPTANTNQIPAPVSTPKVEVPTSLSTSQLSKTTTQPQVVDNSGLIKTIQSTLDKAPTAKLNEQGLEGLLKIAGLQGGSRPDLLGAQLKDAINTLKIGDKFSNPNLVVDMPPTIVPEDKKGTSGTPTQSEWENKGNSGAAPFSPKTATQKLQEIQDEYNSSMTENVVNQGVVSEYQAKANEAQANIQALDEQQSALSAKNSLEALGLKSDFLDFQKKLDESGAETSRNKGIILGDEQSRVNFDLSKLSIEDGKNLANYTLARIPLVQNYNIAKGNYDAASTYAKNVADAYEKSAKFQLDVLAMQNSISQQDKTALQSQITNEINYMKEGMTAIDDNQLEKIKADIISGKTNGATLWTDPVTGKNWFKPKGVVSEETKAELLSPTEAKVLGVPYGTTKGQAMALGITPTDVETIGGLTKEQLLELNKIRADMRQDPDIKEFSTVRDAYTTGSDAVNRKNSAGDIILMRMIAKITDPTTGVREEEFRTFEGAQGTLAKFGITLTKKMWGAGTLTEEGRKQLFGVMQDIYNRKKTAYDNANSFFANQGSTLGIPKNLLILDKGLKAKNYDDYYKSLSPDQMDSLDELQRKYPNLSDEDFYQLILDQGVDFNDVGGDTNQASIQLGSRLAKVNNNPGNLRYAGQNGASQGEGGFARFETPQAGYDALKNQIKLDASRGLTLEKFINKYAPPSENDTNLYVQQMVRETGASKNTPISNINLETLAKAMAKKESSTIIS